uniref:Ionotropic glutamate receptor C-terminal domain-containing protein n=1 Tax=Stomoxys calcitrans TaxID=35570 RepID=A0A1I8P224_STOCA
MPNITDINWTQIINTIIQMYLQNITICVLWPTEGDFTLINDVLASCGVINIYTPKLNSSFDKNLIDYEKLQQKFECDGLFYNDLTVKLTISIENSHCESFLVFESDILPFIESFKNASRYSEWRSKRNHFIFATSKEVQEFITEEEIFFKDQPHILVVFAQPTNPNIFELKTNKFNGPNRSEASSLIFLDRFHAVNNSFEFNQNLFPDKIRNLQGREVIVAGFDYHPYFVIKYVQEQNNSYDLAFGSSDEGRVQIDGTETRAILTMCEILNCTVLIDSSEANDWGEVYANLSGDASLGMVAKGTAEISVGAMYSWDDMYLRLDMSTYLVRTGVTCLVPAPKLLATWLLPLQPFQLTLWLAVLAYLCLEWLSLSLTHRCESWFHSNKNLTWMESIVYGFVTTLKSFISQMDSGYVRSQTMRVLLFTCFLNNLIITSIYDGGLASILTIPSYGEAADTVHKMLSHKLQWVANSEAWVSTIRKSDDPLLNGILENFFIYPDETIEELAVSAADYGFTLERLPFGHFAIGNYLTSDSIDSMKIMQEDLYNQYSVAFVSRCWPLLSQFDDLLYWWHSAGLDKYWEWRVVADNMNMQKQKQLEASIYSYREDIGPVKLAMSNFVGILMIWLIGILISLGAFVYELLRGCGNRIYRKRIRKVTTRK